MLSHVALLIDIASPMSLQRPEHRYQIRLCWLQMADWFNYCFMSDAMQNGPFQICSFQPIS